MKNRIIVVVLAALLGLTVSPAVQASSPILYGAIRWDAWASGVDPAIYGVPPSLYTDYDYRQPTEGWTNDSQEIVDAEINSAADGGLDYWIFDWLPPQSLFPTTIRQLSNATDLTTGPLDRYMESAYKSRLKFAFLIQTASVANAISTDEHGLEYYWESVEIPAIVSYMNDTQYVKLDGDRPVLFWLYPDQINVQPAGFGEQWSERFQHLRDAVTSAGHGDLFLAAVSTTPQIATQYGMDALSHYGVYPGSGMQCYAAQASADLSVVNSDSVLMTVIPTITASLDPRPHNYGYWSQRPTRGQWMTHLGEMRDWMVSHPSKTTSPPLALVYAWNELSEGGIELLPSAQDGSMFLEGIAAVKENSIPSQYVSTVNDDNCNIVYSGSWLPESFPIHGKYDNNERSSSGSNATLTTTWGDTTGFVIYGSGDIHISVDGQDRTGLSIVDLPRGTHTLMLSGHPISIDRIDILKSTVAQTDGDNLARLSFSASSSWSGFPAYQAFDGLSWTAWQAANGIANEWLYVDFGYSRTFNKAIISEYGNRTTAYRIDYWDGAWHTAYSGATIGASSTVVFPTVTGSRVRLYFISGSYTPIIYSFEIYNAH